MTICRYSLGTIIVLSPKRKKLTAWLIGRLDKADELPLRYLDNNHLRRDIGLDPIWPDGWPH